MIDRPGMLDCKRSPLLVGLLLLGVLAGGAAVYAINGETRDPADKEAVAQAQAISRAFRSAVREVMPAVVKVESTVRPQPAERRPAPRRPHPFEGTPWEDFFPEEFFDRFEGLPQMPDQPMRRGVGSGVIVDAEGIILTNSHVVDGADEVLVELADGRQFKATDIRSDLRTDLAVLRIETDSPLPVARLGDSDELEIGDWVVAMGNPFELSHTVSAGIISAKGRTLSGSRRAERAIFLQTDAAINPGNSGGPLVALDGTVVGINTAIASRSGGFQGIGFAIPINLARWVSEQLVEHGTVRRAYLGVSIRPITADLADHVGVPVRGGVLVMEAHRDTPAAKAGLEPGDVILSFAGRPVTTTRELQEVVERSAPGAEQEIEILRDGERMTLTVTLESMAEDFSPQPDISRRAPAPEEGYSHDELGLEVSEMTAEQAEQLGYTGQKGALITRVARGSPASMAGLSEGQLILRVGQETVTSVAEFEEAMEGVSLENGVLLLVRTPAGNRFVVIRGN